MRCSRCFSAMSESESSRCSPSMNRITCTEPPGGAFFVPPLPPASVTELDDARTDWTMARAYATTVSRMISRHTMLRICFCVSGNSATTPRSASRLRHSTTAWHSVTAGGELSRSSLCAL